MSTETLAKIIPVGGRLGHAAVRTACPYCGVGCGVLAEADGSGGAAIAGDPEHPANFGRLCLKGALLGRTLSLEGRALRPKIGARAATWDEALDLVSRRFSAAVAEHGPDAVAFYVSGQLLTEDYYVANKLIKGFFGTANIDTNSRLCMASSVAGHRRAFGSDTVPGIYEDLERADLIVLAGSNLAWCHPVLHQRVAAAKLSRPELRVVVLDPRQTPTAEIADLHLALAPGSDVALFAGLLVQLDERGRRNRTFTESFTSGLEHALAAARAAVPTIEIAAALTGLPRAAVAQFYAWTAQTERMVTIYSQGVNQSSAGSDKVNAIVNCHLLTGRIGRAGMGPFSVTGQPNAMGGREVGALATQLAAHMGFEQADRVRRFWRSPSIATRPGLAAVDLFAAVGLGRIKALWIMATNPAASLPDSEQVRRALAACPFVVVSDCVEHTDTAERAHVMLPALAWGEKNGTVTNSERMITRQRAFLPPPGEAKPDWWMLSEAAKRLGAGAAFAFAGPADIFREHAALSAFENGGTRDFDIGDLARISDAEYEALAPCRWPLPARGPRIERFFGSGGFFTADRRARFVPTPPRKPAFAPDADFPLILNSGRIRDQWHTMTRTGAVPALMRHCGETVIEIHAADAARQGLEHGDLAELTSRWGRLVSRVAVSPAQAQGQIFVPMHWTDQFAGLGRVNALVNPAVDPVSFQPELKHTPVRLNPWRPAWRALAFARDPIRPETISWWNRRALDSHQRFALADTSEPDRGWLALTRLFGLDSADDDIMLADEGETAVQRAARFDPRGHLAAFLLFVSGTREPAADETWIKSCFERPCDGQDRQALASGRLIAANENPVLCVCLNIARSAVAAAISGGARTLDSIAAVTRAGTNCGSCRPEIAALAAALNRERAA